MARPAGVTAAVLPGDLEFSAGGMNADFLIGAFVKEVTTSGLVTLQNANGDERQVQIAGVQGGAGAVDVLTTPVSLPRIAFGVAGTIADLTLTNAGMNYEGIPNLEISGGGGMGAVGTVQWDRNTMEVTGVRLRNIGSGYTSPPTVTITGTGTGAMARVTHILGIGTVTITNGGSGYTSAPTVTFSGGDPSLNARGTAIVSGGAVTGVNVTYEGSNYVSAPTVTFSGGGGSGATATAQVDAVTVVSQGSADRGSGYVSDPTVTVTGGGGTGLMLNTRVSSGQVYISIANDGNGRGYTQNPLAQVVGGSGSGAYGLCLVENGEVTEIRRFKTGSGYVSGEAVTVNIIGGGGSGATATAEVTGTTVSNFTLTNGGSGYTNPPTITVTSGDPGSGATATATVAPVDWLQVLTADQWMDKSQLFMFLGIDYVTAGTSGIQLSTWNLPTYNIMHQLLPQSSMPIQLWRTFSNTAGTTGFVETATGRTSSLRDPAGVFYLAKDSSNNLWFSALNRGSRILRIGAA